jgi:hypothetical protein
MRLGEAIGTTAKIEIYHVYNGVEYLGGSYTPSANTFDFAISLANSLPAGVAITNPGIGYRLRYTNSTASVDPLICLSILSIKIRMYPAASGKAAKFITHSLPDEDTYASSIDQYRVVSMSAWLEYEGSDLTNGGQLAAISYKGGRDPMLNGLWDYNKIAETPGSYQGALKLGNYSVWRPSNERDMMFRNLNTDDRWNLPYIVVAGKVSSADVPATLRLRVVINYEFISTAQFYSYSHSPVAPELIAHAATMLRDFPTSMENPLHFKEIKQFLQKTIGLAQNVGSWVMKNSHWIAPAATALLAL